MALEKKQKRKAKREKKLKERRQRVDQAAKKDKGEFLFSEALWFWDSGNLDKALGLLERAVTLDPANEYYLKELARLGYEMKKPDLELKALLSLFKKDLLDAEMMPYLSQMLLSEKKYEQALEILNQVLSRLPALKIRNKKALKTSLDQTKKYCQFQIETAEHLRTRTSHKNVPGPAPPKVVKKGPGPEKTPLSGQLIVPKPLPEIGFSVEVDTSLFEKAFLEERPATTEQYELVLEAQGIRFKETFEHLIALHSLQNVRSFWYQEETVRKILKTFRGRALLADEVGLGKTIEALMVLKEYIQRGMVKSALILTPTPLVSQWQDELGTKFGLFFPSTNDPDYRTNEASFWQQPFILSSINIAKSKKNFSLVTEREYDLVIVDEAHHLKNRNTLNWKLVNALKKRFLLLLTATPVENNLMEIYNLVTLLKPGQLKTASGFRNEFMTRGDPTDPRNRGKLRELLGQVMIRNTRALARVDIPPRFARTIRVTPFPVEIDLYERISALAKNIAATNGHSHRLLLKNLLEEAGSSPRAVSLTLQRVLAKQSFLRQQEEEIETILNVCRSLDESSKNTRLLEIIKGSPDKKIIFVKYLGTLEYVSDFLSWQGLAHALFHGGLDNRMKEEQIRLFKEERDILLTTEIGGEGRNLQFCRWMINYDLPWNPMKIEQRIGRIHRIGQEKEVMIDNLCAAGSIEDYILDLLDKKINMFELVIGEIDMILGRIEGEQDFSDIIFEIWLGSKGGPEREIAFDKLGTSLKRAKTGYQKTKDLDEKLFGEDYEL